MSNAKLYILMRSDMDSLNPGKAIAQGAHAAQMASMECEFNVDHISVAWADWKSQTDSFYGTVITLDVGNESRLRAVVDVAQDAGFPANVVLDPSYPIRDGQTTHLLPVTTCGFVFYAPTIGDDNDRMVEALSQFSLYA